MAVGEIYVSRGSTARTLSLSILLRRRFPKTIFRFLYGVRSKRNHGSSTGREARANFGRPFATEHLKRTVNWNERWSDEIRNVSFCSFRLAFGEEQLRSNVRRCMLFRAGHIPKSCRILSADTLPSNQIGIKQNIVTNHAGSTYLPSLPSHCPRGHGPHPTSVRQSSEPRPASIDPTS